MHFWVAEKAYTNSQNIKSYLIPLISMNVYLWFFNFGNAPLFYQGKFFNGIFLLKVEILVAQIIDDFFHILKVENGNGIGMLAHSACLQPYSTECLNKVKTVL